MTPFEMVLAFLGICNFVGVGGVWHRLGVALESNRNAHQRVDRVDAKLDSAIVRVSDLEKIVWRAEHAETCDH